MNINNLASWRDNLPVTYPYQFRQNASFAFGDGWLPVFAELCERIDRLLTEAQKLDFFWTDIKEKHGFLSLSYAAPPEAESAIDELIEVAEDEALETCTVCGEPGEMRNGPSPAVLCDQHAGSRTALDDDQESYRY
jgi:hypothetical protein